MTSTAERPIAILSAPGSRGDVNPMVGIGHELTQRGFDVVISLAETYAELAQAKGLQTEALISQSEFDELLEDPNVWRPMTGAKAVLCNAAGKFIEPHLAVIQKHLRPGRTVLVAHPLDFASRIFRDHDPTTPLVSVQLSPAIVRSAENPPRLSPWWLEPRRPPWLVSLAYTMADYLIADRFLAPSVNKVRSRLGLKSVSRILDRWWLSPDMVLGLYPSWFGNTRPPCSGIWRTCGFPMEKSNEDLANYRASFSSATDFRRSIFFTPGTAHRHARDFFLNAIEASRMLGRTCILATSQKGQLPDTLPEHATAVGYVNLDATLRKCAAIVHHGGIGTTAAAFSTGCPQLVCPMAFDQYHNAECVYRLEAGKVLKNKPWKHSPANVKGVASSLSELLNNAQTQMQCDHFAKLNQDFRGSASAADSIVMLLSS